MRRLCFFALILSLLVFPARAASGPVIAIAIDSGPNGKYTQQLLDGLYDRGILGTFLLQGRRMAEYPEIVSRILQEGHEAAYRGYSGKSMASMSRRAIAAELLDSQALLPENCHPKFLCSPGGISDGVRQVAQARKLALLDFAADFQAWPQEADPLSRIRDGDILRLCDNTKQAVEVSLQILDELMKEDIQIVTVTDLAKQKNAVIRPGEIYRRFPAQ